MQSCNCSHAVLTEKLIMGIRTDIMLILFFVITWTRSWVFITYYEKTNICQTCWSNNSISLRQWGRQWQDLVTYCQFSFAMQNILCNVNQVYTWIISTNIKPPLYAKSEYINYKCAHTIALIMWWVLLLVVCTRPLLIAEALSMGESRWHKGSESRLHWVEYKFALRSNS